MTNNIEFTIEDLPLLWESTVGLERETVRINSNGLISESDHPHDWGNRSFHPYLQTDFSESQLELITPPFSTNEEVINWLAALHQIAQDRISISKPVETLWPYSMPPRLSNINQIRSAVLDDQGDYNYRKYLISYYGKKVQLLSGIHYNFQINEQLLNQKLKVSELEYVSNRNKVYMDLTRKYLYYRWVLTHLLGATPYFSDDYETVLYGKPHKTVMKSVRQSRYGYRNSQNVSVSYQDFYTYVTDIEDFISRGFLHFEKELYRDVRMRGAKPNRAMLTEGISYLEFRNFDLNPFQLFGISLEDLDFIKVWILSLLLHQQSISEEEIHLANERNQNTAESNPTDPLINKELFKSFSQTLLAVAKNLDFHFYPDSYLSHLVSKKLEQIELPIHTLSGQITSQYTDFKDFTKGLLKLSQTFQKQSLKNKYLLHGFEKLELSTQALIKKAIELGIQVTIIDKEDNLIELQFNEHTELIKNANMTSLDSQVSYFLMDNKTATKFVLDRENIQTPKGRKFNNLNQAIKYYTLLDKSAIVIKPQNTNYGLGITIFDNFPEKETYIKAMKEAFKHDHTVLVEEFIEGIELRFYVQNQKVLAICERQAAHIIGDGQHTIEQLIDLENQHPFRGPRHLAPLTLLEKGEIERLTLADQSYSLQSIPFNGKKVYLRKNSNVSSGGIAIDRTNQVHSDFIKIAEQTAAAMKATFCGVDIIIKNYREPISNSNSYAVLEANYNPMMSLHLFPAIGQAQPLAEQALELLFPELH
ncbi:bifunctional glutamate--cysteine ligase GshA/glutathione synthetase GshB [Facklamia sp. 7083-14-GEN3]|uniref:bifunctional glutamate--cysteine ligase GshA/glutathione synthetase GshB n=1 Tax=Facklamia sp. 7083-14-GEN3 TaxID=2973478 RepID=UPI00215D061E|nr:bifunctional glutamate--cysteine ligase GshA/glutathione synthetase GshB [Facklamia sp. 7083-14-GEN3]MCR8970010.1 bifunctional glutamate--cysteine ligase GshA/glutathione synthetase GshB [Facklamia sp. 7083-14-GEN3]